ADVAAAGPEPGTARPREPVRLRDWRVADGPAGRSLRLEFLNPVGGSCEVRLELVPRYPLGAGAGALPLPSPRGKPSAAAGEVGHLAYRADGVQAQIKQVERVTNVDAARFAQAWPADLRPDLGTLAYACSFRREEGKGPRL